ncbi:MAG: enterochelin esterase [Chlorobia bacterium]|nr:enterochelin esterase [Fimbriimonadaceae bacterium]
MLSVAALYLMHMQGASMDFKELERNIVTNRPAAEAMVRKHILADELLKGANPREQGTRVLFAVDAGPGKHTVTLANKGKTMIHLAQMGESTLYIALQDFYSGDAYLLDYQVDGKTLRGGLQVEVYDPNPFTLAPPGGRKGELRDMGEWKSSIYSGTTRKWYIYLPPNLDALKEYPVLIATDAQWDRDWIANGLENCAREGLIPQTVGVFIEPGQNNPGTYSNRSAEYDALSPKYTEFLLTEILPQVEKVVKLSKDPAKRALTGMSSGGICSFTACWERPDQFGVALSFIGSFANIASGASKREGGHNYPFLIRKNEKKPIRVFLQDGDNDLNNDHGSWWLGNLQMESALKYKGYDHVWVPGKGFHNTKHARRVFDKALSWWLNPAK